MYERIEILEIGETRSAHNRSRNLASVEERWQGLQTCRECSHCVTTGLDQQLRCSCAQITHFEARVLHELALHAQCPGQHLRLDLIKDYALGCQPGFLLSGGRHVHLPQASSSEETR